MLWLFQVHPILLSMSCVVTERILQGPAGILTMILCIINKPISYHLSAYQVLVLDSQIPNHSLSQTCSLQLLQRRQPTPLQHVRISTARNRTTHREQGFLSRMQLMMYRTIKAVCVCIDTGFVGLGSSIRGRIHCRQYMVAVAIHTTAGHIYKEGCQLVAISLGLREPTLIQVYINNSDTLPGKQNNIDISNVTTKFKVIRFPRFSIRT